jgi:hypothetical protein
MKPLLTHSLPTLIDTMPIKLQSFAKLFTSKKQLYLKKEQEKQFENEINNYLSNINVNIHDNNQLILND